MQLTKARQQNLRTAEKGSTRSLTRQSDFSVFVVTLILVLFGIIMVFSASYYTASTKLDEPFYYFIKQIIGAGLGLVAMIFLMKMDYHLLGKMNKFLLAISLLMLLVVFVPGVGKNLNGSSRWIDLKVISIQPAEVAKFALVIFMSWYLYQNKQKMHSFFRGVLPMLCVIGVFCVAILAQPNFSMVVCIAFITLVMLYAGGAKGWHLVGLILLAIVAAIILVKIEPYRMKRFTIFTDPWQDPQGDGYQLIQSFYAITSGGLFGKGLGMGQQKLLFLPYSESDFIFSIIAEELGLLGCVVIMGLYLYLIYRGIRIALTCKDSFGSLLATGITALIGVQVMINVAVVTGSIPPTGQPLPFISAGSSSLIMFMAVIGVLLNISKNCQKT